MNKFLLSLLLFTGAAFAVPEFPDQLKKLEDEFRLACDTYGEPSCISRFTAMAGCTFVFAMNSGKTTQEALDIAAETAELIAKDLPDASEYVVPFAYLVRWRVKLNLREVYHLVELRSTRQGHPSYRAIAQQMYQQIQIHHPTLVDSMKFVDLNDYALERLSSEQRIDFKLRQQNQ